ncbi:MAG: outer membrane protein assembly factor BamB [Burkholderiales bacterium]|nr:outer membrane protein assembly factor BamB [Burkholderiales bacterium]
MMKFKTFAIAASCIGLLAACSTPKHVPAELKAFEPGITVSIVWNRSLPSPNSYLVPGVNEDSVFVAGNRELARYSAYNADREWGATLEERITGGVGTDGYITAVGLENGNLVVVDGQGSPDWTSKLTSELAGPPVVAGGLVVVRTKDMRITAFEASTGDVQWNYQRSQPALTVDVPVGMIARDNLLIVGQPNGHVVILDLPSGRPVFEFPVAQAKGITEVERLIDVVGTPALSYDLLCAAAYQGAVTCVDTTNGQLKWSHPVDAVAGPAIDDDNVYVVDAAGKVHAYYRESGEPRWENAELTYRQLTAPVVVPGAVAVGDFEGYLHFLSPRTGDLIGRTRLSGPIVVPGQHFSDGAIFQTQKGEVAYVATR